MTPFVEQTPAGQSAETDLAAAVHRVLEASPEPLTLSKIRAALLGKAVADVTTRAHLQESQARIAAALGAQMEKGVD